MYSLYTLSHTHGGNKHTYIIVAPPSSEFNSVAKGAAATKSHPDLGLLSACTAAFFYMLLLDVDIFIKPR
jgi:hypothetical protein